MWSLHRTLAEQQHYPNVLIRNRSRETSAVRASFNSGGIRLKCLGSHNRAKACAAPAEQSWDREPPCKGTLYLSLCVSWQRLISGTEMTPQRLYWPSPMERETSSTPSTLPSLHRKENTQSLLHVCISLHCLMGTLPASICSYK